MSEKNYKQSWERYRKQELTRVTPLLQKLGFELEKRQPHIGGERFLMQSATTPHGRKLALLGRCKSTNKKVFIKVTSETEGKKELEHERLCKEALRKINFAYDTFFSPKEILCSKEDGFLIVIQDFIEQEKPFLERNLEEQFDFALRGFKAQESAHATTHKHQRFIERTFGSRTSKEYLDRFKDFVKETPVHNKVMKRALAFLEKDTLVIEQYTGFLTHVDFVPHNFRIVGGEIYLLDQSSLRFGNKYEGWARFLNFMTLYNPALEKMLVQYMENNRTPEETLSLKCMRVYRLGEIIWYYTNTLTKCSGNLKRLNTARTEWWAHVLESILEEKTVNEHVRDEYIKTRDMLRDEEEKGRQVRLH